MQKASFDELFNVIGTLHGGDGISLFKLPDYQGRFLRGCDHGAGRDPDAAERTAPASGGASGDSVGSVQGSATGAPLTPFTAQVPHAPNDYHYAFGGCSTPMLWWGSDPVAVNSSGGGDHETRPVNGNVNFIIKVNSRAELPLGVVVPLAGTNAQALAQNWLFCDGSSYAISVYNALYNSIGSVHGGGGGNFNVPDYRGRFLRGVNNGSGRDPDAANREAANAGGAAGDAVGSVQGWATAPPVTPFKISLPNMGGSSVDCCKVEGHDNAAYDGGSTSVNLTSKGGDAESRPPNLYVDWFLYCTETKDDPFPIGGVMGFAGPKAPSDHWMICEGSSLPVIDTFKALLTAIGTCNGGDGATVFYIPDFRGRFLRGRDRGAQRDPDGGTRSQPLKTSGASGDSVGSVQNFATGKPVNTAGVTGNVPHLPTDWHPNVVSPSTQHNICNWVGDTATPKVEGGDKESRPVNANCTFYIRFM